MLAIATLDMLDSVVIHENAPRNVVLENVMEEGAFALRGMEELIAVQFFAQTPAQTVVFVARVAAIATRGLRVLTAR